MAYLWTTTAEIQAYLDSEGTIQIDTQEPPDEPGLGEMDKGETFTAESAQQFENEAVYEISTFLSMAYESDSSAVGNTDQTDISIYGDTPLGLKSEASGEEAPVCPKYLRLLSAKYTAAKIAMVRIGASLGSLPNWIREFENDVFGQLRRLVINAETACPTGLKCLPDFDVGLTLVKMKTRGQGVMETINN